ncbi:hypothetical protein BgAZ_403950 [Babesia gibsoni]|uniref:Uncharacterized protein n=1 Tax=Babesia gibsoni TaxID=33632 RepID=A0AAD8P898_BABGI|nr:hypothetical protein BgAZ_403950 [Babesia gibsoni]
MSQFCEGGSILEADSQNPLEDALQSCQTRKECTFLCHTVKKRYPPRSSNDVGVIDSDAIVPNSSASWLCSGNGWIQLYPKYGWVTAVKGRAIRELCKPFAVWLNQTAECSRKNTLDVARDINPREATQLCSNMAECTFFTMVRSITRYANWFQSLQSHESKTAFGTLTHFCRGMPSKRIARDGYILVASRKIQQDMQREEPVKAKNSSKIAYYFGGPLTNDSYYDDKTPGSLVPATRL